MENLEFARLAYFFENWWGILYICGNQKGYYEHSIRIKIYERPRVG
ncbi:hypothetical protein B0O79_1214 [Flavobacteriaceae bacterium MAR_2009_75]|nr:hypothetical protein B0O79_1214 [Flavobacteriaceae bacterium MAR_2009_75]